MSSLQGLIVPSIINNNVVHGEAFLPGQILVFGGFALWANSLGHLEQIESYAPGHQVRFGSLDGRHPWGLDLRWIRATTGRAALPRWV